MTMYHNAMVAGAGTIQQLAALPAAGRAAYDASYQRVYSTEMAKYNAIQAQSAIRGNIATVLQNKVLNDIEIQMNQAEAEAAARVEAAAAGARGMSVEQSIDQTRLTQVRRESANEKAAKAEMSGFASQVGQYQATIDSSAQVEDYGSFSNVLLGSLGSIDLDLTKYHIESSVPATDVYESSSVWDFEQSDFD